MTLSIRFNVTGTRSPACGYVLQSLMLATLAITFASGTRAQSKPESKPPPAASAPTPAPIDRNGVLILIRSTLLALDQANKTGNYTVLRDLGSPGFQTNTAARLAEIFANQRKENIDLSGVAVLEPQLTMLPQIEANGMMRMAGFFPSVPTQANFEMAFAPVERQWRLFGISVSFGRAAPVAPPAEQPPAVPQAQVTPPKGAAPQARAHGAYVAPPGVATKTAPKGSAAQAAATATEQEKR